MTQIVSRAFSHSIFLLMDPEFGEIPLFNEQENCSATSSCVAIGTLFEYDGDSTIEVSDVESVPIGYSLVFKGKIELGKMGLNICDINLNSFLKLNYENNTIIKVYSNDESEPDHFLICF